MFFNRFFMAHRSESMTMMKDKVARLKDLQSLSRRSALSTSFILASVLIMTLFFGHSLFAVSLLQAKITS